MPGPPELPKQAQAKNPLDRALSAHLAGDDEAALRISAGLLRQDPAGPAGLFVTAKLVGRLGGKTQAVQALEACVTASIDSANLGLAVAACEQLEALGADPTSRLDAVASMFAKGSRRLQEQGAAPPKMPGADDGFEPLPDDLSGEGLIEAASKVLGESCRAIEEAIDARSAPPPIRPLPLFSKLARAGLRAIVGALDIEIVDEGHVIIEEGSGGDAAYVVARGELEVARHEEERDVRLARLGNGALFGEMALLSRSPRTASVVACRPSIILVAKKEALDRIAEKNPEVGAELAAHCHQRMVENVVRTSPLLKTVKIRERPALMSRFVTRTFEPEDKLIEQDSPPDGLHLLASGNVKVVHREADGQTVITQLGPGDYVGEVALVLRRPANADVVAEFPTVTLELPAWDFLSVCRQHPEFLAELYLVAVERDKETQAIASAEATEVDDLVLV